MKFFPDLVRCMPVAANSPRILIRWVEKELLNLLTGYVINVDLGDVKEVLRLLRINSNNLNQYAKRANETGSIYEADIKDLQKGHQEILARMGEILERLSSI